MGLIYDSADSANVMGALAANLTAARTMVDETEQASRHLLASLGTGQLCGSGYDAISLLFSEAVLPSVRDRRSELAALQKNLERYRWEDSKVSRFGVLDEDQLTTQLRATRAQRDATEHMMEVNAAASSLVPLLAEALDRANRSLQLVLNQLENDVRDLEERLEALRQFDARTRGLFRNDNLPGWRGPGPSSRKGAVSPASFTVPAAGASIQQIAQWLLSGAYSIEALTAACGAAAVMAAVALVVLGGVGKGSTAGSRFYTPEERVRRTRLEMYYWTHNLDGSVRQHIGPAQTPLGKYLDEAPTFADVNDVLKDKTRKGNNSGVREVDTPEEVRDIYKEIARGSDAIEDVGTYDGERRRLPDGTEIGIRDNSSSGGVTIDIKSPKGKEFKIHLPKGWGK